MIFGMQNKRTLLMTGVPRSGTTLCCHLMNLIPNTIALHEPISNERCYHRSDTEAVSMIKDFAQDRRKEALALNKVQSKQADAQIPSNPVTSAEGKLRKEHVTLDYISIDKTLGPEFLLVIKHNALFTALLSELLKDFRCYAIIRNPLATIASWQTVDLPIHSGHIPMGEYFDKKLESKLSSLNSTLDRQLFILRWFFEIFEKHLDRSQVIRYEDIIESKGRILSSIIAQKFESDFDFKNKNVSAFYKKLDIDLFLNRLMAEEDIYNKFYTVDDLKILAQEIHIL